MIIHEVEQGSEDWHRLRWGKVTGTNISRINKAARKEYIAEIIAKQSSEFEMDWDSFESFEMERGKEQEIIARYEYERRTQQEVRIAGFIQHHAKWRDLFGISPDGLIGDYGAIESKCPSTKTHILTLMNGKVMADNLPQCLSYFVVNPKLQWLDFISFDPRFVLKSYFQCRLTREEYADKIAEYENELDKFEADVKKYYDLITF